MLYGRWFLLLRLSYPKKNVLENNICIEIQSLFPFPYFFFSGFHCTLLLLCWLLIGRLQARLSCSWIWSRMQQIGPDLLNSLLSFFFIIAVPTKPTKTWRRQRKQPWSTRQRHPHRSSSRSACRRMWKNKRLIRAKMTTQRNRRNQDFVSCFRFFCSSSRSQRCSAYSSSTTIRRVSKNSTFFASIMMVLLMVRGAHHQRFDLLMRSIKVPLRRSNLAKNKIRRRSRRAFRGHHVVLDVGRNGSLMLISDWKFFPLIHDVRLGITKWNHFPRWKEKVSTLVGCYEWESVRLMSRRPRLKHKTPAQLIIASCAYVGIEWVKECMHLVFSTMTSCTQCCLFLFTCSQIWDS